MDDLVHFQFLPFYFLSTEKNAPSSSKEHMIRDKIIFQHTMFECKMKYSVGQNKSKRSNYSGAKCYNNIVLIPNKNILQVLMNYSYIFNNNT